MTIEELQKEFAELTAQREKIQASTADLKAKREKFSLAAIEANQKAEAITAQINAIYAEADFMGLSKRRGEIAEAINALKRVQK